MKQRLVGTIVLGCLALIFIPLLLDGEGMVPQPLTLEIPPEPEIIPLETPEPERPLITEDTLSDADTAAPVDLGNLPEFIEPADSASLVPSEAGTETVSTTVNEPEAERLPAFDPRGLPEGWVVRLGIFGERRNADALLGNLNQAGYKAYPEEVSNAQGIFTGIFVGPVLTRAEANSLKTELQTRFKLDGLVQQFSLNQAQ